MTRLTLSTLALIPFVAIGLTQTTVPLVRDVPAPVSIVWDMGIVQPGGPDMSALVAAVEDELRAQLPDSERDAWALAWTNPGADGAFSIDEFRAHAERKVRSLNQARNAEAEAHGRVEPPAFSVDQGSDGCSYVYSDHVRYCSYTFGLRLGGVAWSVVDPATTLAASLRVGVTVADHLP